MCLMDSKLVACRRLEPVVCLSLGSKATAENRSPRRELIPSYRKHIHVVVKRAREGSIVRVLVTGGAGFIGTNFVKMAIKGNFNKIGKITVLDSLTYAGNLKNFTPEELQAFEFIQGDICDEQLVQRLFPSIDAVINFAAESHVDNSITNSIKFMKTNVMGVHNLLTAAQKHQHIRIVQVSTDEVYGSISEGSWIESDPLLPNSPYSASKAGAELLVRSYVKTFQLDCVVTRCSNNYGPYQHPEKLIPRFVTNILEGKKVPLYGDGLNVRDWLHVEDHCLGIYLALCKGLSGETYNIGGGAEFNNLEITENLISYFGKSAEWIEFIADRPGHDFRYSVDWSKSKSVLGYRPEKSFSEGLAMTIRWYEENPQWWKQLK